MSDVQRYDPRMDSSEVFMGMCKDVIGDYVEYDDYAKLEAENRRLREALENINRLILRGVDARYSVAAIKDLFDALWKGGE